MDKTLVKKSRKVKQIAERIVKLKATVYETEKKF